MAKFIPAFFFLAALAGSAQANDSALLTPGQTITIPSSKGKFDFLEVDAAHHRLLAAHEKDGTADFIDLESNRLITRLPLGPAVHVCLDAKTNQYFVSGSDEKKVYVVDAASLKPAGEIAMDGELDAILYEPKNNRVYITNDEGMHVWVIDPDAKQVVATIDIQGPPEYMLYDAGSDRIFLNLKKANAVAVIDPNPNSVTHQWSTLPAEGPHGLAFDAASGRLFAAGANGKLAIVDAKTGKLVTAVKIASGVDQNAFDPSTRRIYCAAGGELSIVQETEDGGRLLGSVKTAPTAKNVAVDPANHSVWTTYTDGTNSYAKQFTP